MSTFLHQAYDEALSTKQDLQSVQFKVQIVSTPLAPPPNEQTESYVVPPGMHRR